MTLSGWLAHSGCCPYEQRRWGDWGPRETRGCAHTGKGHVRVTEQAAVCEPRAEASAADQTAQPWSWTSSLWENAGLLWKLPSVWSWFGSLGRQAPASMWTCPQVKAATAVSLCQLHLLCLNKPRIAKVLFLLLNSELAQELKQIYFNLRKLKGKSQKHKCWMKSCTWISAAFLLGKTAC